MARQRGPASKALRSGLAGVELARLHHEPGRLGRAIENGLQRAHDVVPAVEDAQRDDRLAAEQDAENASSAMRPGSEESVRAEAQDRVAATAL